LNVAERVKPQIGIVARRLRTALSDLDLRFVPEVCLSRLYIRQSEPTLEKTRPLPRRC